MLAAAGVSPWRPPGARQVCAALVLTSRVGAVDGGLFFLFSRYRLPCRAGPSAACAACGRGAGPPWLRPHPAAPARSGRADGCRWPAGRSSARGAPRCRASPDSPRSSIWWTSTWPGWQRRAADDEARRSTVRPLTSLPATFWPGWTWGTCPPAAAFSAALPALREGRPARAASDDAETNLGGIYLALGHPAAAAAHLEQALAFNPAKLFALQNSALLALPPRATSRRRGPSTDASSERRRTTPPPGASPPASPPRRSDCSVRFPARPRELPARVTSPPAPPAGRTPAAGAARRTACARRARRPISSIVGQRRTGGRSASPRRCGRYWRMSVERVAVDAPPGRPACRLRASRCPGPCPGSARR